MVYSYLYGINDESFLISHCMYSPHSSLVQFFYMLGYMSFEFISVSENVYSGVLSFTIKSYHVYKRCVLQVITRYFIIKNHINFVINFYEIVIALNGFSYTKKNVTLTPFLFSMILKIKKDQNNLLFSNKTI